MPALMEAVGFSEPHITAPPPFTGDTPKTPSGCLKPRVVLKRVCTMFVLTHTYLC